MDSVYGGDMDLDSAYTNCLPPWFDPHPHPLDEPPPPPAPAPRLSLSGPATTGSIFYRTPRPEHPRLRTSQACEKCRARKAKCSGDHPSCARCLARGLPCQYAEVGRVRGPNKNRSSRSASTASSTSTDSRYVNVNVKRARRNTTLATIDLGGSGLLKMEPLSSCEPLDSVLLPKNSPHLDRSHYAHNNAHLLPTAASKRLSLPASLNINIDSSLLSPMHGHGSGPSYAYGSEYPTSDSASTSSAYTDSRRGSFAIDPALDALPPPPSPFDSHSPFPHEMKPVYNHDYPPHVLDPLDHRSPFTLEAGYALRPESKYDGYESGVAMQDFSPSPAHTFSPSSPTRGPNGRSGGGGRPAISLNMGLGLGLGLGLGVGAPRSRGSMSLRRSLSGGSGSGGSGGSGASGASVSSGSTDGEVDSSAPASAVSGSFPLFSGAQYSPQPPYSPTAGPHSHPHGQHANAYSPHPHPYSSLASHSPHSTPYSPHLHPQANARHSLSGPTYPLYDTPASATSFAHSSHASAAESSFYTKSLQQQQQRNGYEQPQLVTPAPQYAFDNRARVLDVNASPTQHRLNEGQESLAGYDEAVARMQAEMVVEADGSFGGSSSSQISIGGGLDGSAMGTMGGGGISASASGLNGWVEPPSVPMPMPMSTQVSPSAASAAQALASLAYASGPTPASALSPCSLSSSRSCSASKSNMLSPLCSLSPSGSPSHANAQARARAAIAAATSGGVPAPLPLPLLSLRIPQGKARMRTGMCPEGEGEGMACSAKDSEGLTTLGSALSIASILTEAGEGEGVPPPSPLSALSSSGSIASLADADEDGGPSLHLPSGLGLGLGLTRTLSEDGSGVGTSPSKASEGVGASPTKTRTRARAATVSVPSAFAL